MDTNDNENTPPLHLLRESALDLKHWKVCGLLEDMAVETTERFPRTSWVLEEIATELRDVLDTIDVALVEQQADEHDLDEVLLERMTARLVAIKDQLEAEDRRDG